MTAGGKKDKENDKMGDEGLTWGRMERRFLLKRPGQGPKDLQNKKPG